MCVFFYNNKLKPVFILAEPLSWKRLQMFHIEAFRSTINKPLKKQKKHQVRGNKRVGSRPRAATPQSVTGGAVVTCHCHLSDAAVADCGDTSRTRGQDTPAEFADSLKTLHSLLGTVNWVRTKVVVWSHKKIPSLSYFYK